MNKNIHPSISGLEAIGGDSSYLRAMHGLGRVVTQIESQKEAPVEAAPVELFDWDKQSFELSHEMDEVEAAYDESAVPTLALVVPSSHKGYFDERHPAAVANHLQEQPR